MKRCPATDTVIVDDEPLTLPCVHWGDEPDGHHIGDHVIRMSPANGGDHTWPNENALPGPPPRRPFVPESD